MNFDKQLRAMAHYVDDFNSVIRVNFWRISGDKREVLRGDSFDLIDPYVYTLDDSHGVCIDKTAAQGLMDSLWECGIRPTEGQGSAGQLAAQALHLKDMRDLAFSFKVEAQNDLHTYRLTTQSLLEKLSEYERKLRDANKA